MPNEKPSEAEVVPAVSAAAVIEQPEGDGKETQAGAAVREMAHAAAEVEADATIAAKKAEEEAAKLAKEAGERVAQKWLEQRFAEIEAKAEERITSLKTWLERRLGEIEGKKKEPEPKPENPPEPKPAEGNAPAVPNEPRKKSRLRI